MRQHQRREYVTKCTQGRSQAKIINKLYLSDERPIDTRPLAKKIYVIIRGFKFNPLKLTHNCKLLTTDYNADHNGDGNSDNDSTIF